MKTDAIAVMMKVPIPGQVKTRLTPPLTAKQALDVHIACMQDTFGTLTRLTDLFDIHLFIYPASSGNPLLGPAYGLARRKTSALLIEAADFIPTSFTRHAQEGETFQDRLAHSVRMLFAMGYKRVLQMGTDSPHLETAALKKAHQSLSQNDIVIGPAFDGGFYLLGMKKPYLELYKELPLSSSNTCNELLKKATERLLRFQLLERLHDIDTAETLFLLAEQGLLARSPHLSFLLTKYDASAILGVCGYRGASESG